MDEIGTVRDTALTNVGNFALDIWGKVTRTGADGATAEGTTETSTERSTASTSTSDEEAA